MSRLDVRMVAVLGAGVMGAQIAAHCANVGLKVLLFDLPGEDGGSGPAREAIERLAHLRPDPLATPRHVAAIQPCNYHDDLDRLAGCELVIEAVAERIDIKRELFARIVPHLAKGVVLATNTSGLSVHELSETLPKPLREYFCGVHFFNPPRYMMLVELIAGTETDPALLARLETWLTTRLGKSVVRARDTPNFIANRIGVFSMLATMYHAERLGLGFDVVDALTGAPIGRPKSATYRTADIVGLDTLSHVIATLRERLPDDPWRAYFAEPEWITRQAGRGALGAKSGAGAYRREGERILVFDPATDDWRESRAGIAPEVAEILSGPCADNRLARLRDCPHPQAELLWSAYRDLFHYAAVHLAQIADNARELDLAMRWGFGWLAGPFESWQAAGWRDTARAIAADIEAGRAMADAPLPDWVFEREAAHEAGGSWSPAEERIKPRTALAVYVRQLTYDKVFGERDGEPGETLWRNAGVRLWRWPQQDPRVGILSFETRVHAIDDAVLDGIRESVARAEHDLDALTIWHEAPFSVGANLREVLAACHDGDYARVERMLVRFQQAALALRDAQIPVVAASQGMALGGGCEFLLRVAHRVLAFESAIGLVEPRVGLIPAGGGCAAQAHRAERLARHGNGDVQAFVTRMFTDIFGAAVSGSAPHAFELGYARASDDIVMHPRELLYVALRRARTLADAGWRPPFATSEIVVAGRDGVARCEQVLDTMEGVSEHDRRIARALAEALCGGQVAAGSVVSEEELLALERAGFMALLRTSETRARIAHTLETGKPLRN